MSIYQPLAPTAPLRQQVYETLEALIARNRLEPGQRLVETELAQELGVSRGPIREALQMLAREGWVELRPRHGAYVRKPSLEELEDYFQVRTLLEVEGARLAARGTHSGDDRKERLKELREVVDRFTGVWREHTSDDPKELDEEARQFHQEGSQVFHRGIVELTGNQALVDLLEHLGKRTSWYFSPGVLKRSLSAWREHNRLLRAIERGDEERAVEVMRSHMAATRESYLRAYRERAGE
ncbi:MAG: GntR family transcriptional regulator [Propionibacteriales bacterium]|nr:GntR family transcriptional regulator [Propionibacteriales bacterium]